MTEQEECPQPEPVARATGDRGFYRATRPRGIPLYPVDTGFRRRTERFATCPPGAGMAEPWVLFRMYDLRGTNAYQADYCALLAFSRGEGDSLWKRITKGLFNESSRILDAMNHD